MTGRSQDDLKAALADLEHKLVSADFEGALRAATTDIDWERLDAVDEPTRLRIRAMAAEAFDHIGDYMRAEEIIGPEGQRCEKVLSELLLRGRGTPRTEEECWLLKQKIWIVIHWGYTFYRKSAFNEALKRFEKCATVASQYLDEKGYASRGTLARAYYSIGLAHREQYDYAKAKDNFVRSMQYAWQGFENSTAPRNAITDISVAKCLGLGLSWVYFAEGSLQLAIPLLLAARSILLHHSEELIKAYVDVVYASAQRSKCGRELRGLEEGIRILEASFELFQRKGHAYYKVRAANQLALAYLQKARLPKIQVAQKRQSVKQALRYAREMETSDDPRFVSASLIIRSRIERDARRLSSSEALANRALQIGYQDTFSRVDASIARGEARLELQNYGGAVHDFETALDNGAHNPKVRAVCYLHLTRAFAKKKDIRKAAIHFREWEQIKPLVSENAFINSLGQDSQEDLKKASGDFLVQWSSTKLDPEKIEHELHRFLVKWAKGKSSSDEEGAKLLGISKQTFYNWRGAE